jgi:ketosteroid isomerase-like protein
MSQENLDILRRFIDASNRRDLTALLSCCDPDIELDASRVLIGTPIYRGHEGIERWFRDMAAAWEELQGELLDVVAVADGGNEVVFVGTGSGRGKTTGAPFAIDTAVLVRFTHGKVVQFEWFGTKGEALEAAGLRE